MFKITNKNFKVYLKGSIFLATGGGLPFSASQKTLKFIFDQKKSIKVYDLNEFAKNKHFASIYGVGDPSKANPIKEAELVKIALGKFKKLTRINIDGIIPGEVGAEASSFLAASFLNLPVVDSDLVGGRAAPEIQLDVFSIAGLKITPVMGFSSNGKTVLLEKNINANEIETILRPFFAKNGGSGIIIGYLIKKSVYEKFGMKNTLSLAFQIGSALEKKDISELKKITKAKKIIEEKIIEVSLKSKDGFLQGRIIFENYRIAVKNENILLFRKNKKIAQAPELIIIVDKNFNPIHNAEIGNKTNEEVFIIILSATGYWKSMKGLQLWQPIEKYLKKYC